jgi:hypothetical protein
LTIEAAMTADSLLESGLQADENADAAFNGGTLFGKDGGGRIKVVSCQSSVVREGANT